MPTLGLPPGPQRAKRLLKKPFPPQAAHERSEHCEQSALLFIKHLREQSLLNTRITFEIPPVTSQAPKHACWSLKYLYVKKEWGCSICESKKKYVLAKIKGGEWELKLYCCSQTQHLMTSLKRRGCFNIFK